MADDRNITLGSLATPPPLMTIYGEDRHYCSHFTEKISVEHVHTAVRVWARLQLRSANNQSKHLPDTAQRLFQSIYNTFDIYG